MSQIETNTTDFVDNKSVSNSSVSSDKNAEIIAAAFSAHNKFESVSVSSSKRSSKSVSSSSSTASSNSTINTNRMTIDANNDDNDDDAGDDEDESASSSRALSTMTVEDEQDFTEDDNDDELEEEEEEEDDDDDDEDNDDDTINNQKINDSSDDEYNDESTVYDENDTSLKKRETKRLTSRDEKILDEIISNVVSRSQTDDDTPTGLSTIAAKQLAKRQSKVTKHKKSFEKQRDLLLQLKSKLQLLSSLPNANDKEVRKLHRDIKREAKQFNILKSKLKELDDSLVKFKNQHQPDKVNEKIIKDEPVLAVKKKRHRRTKMEILQAAAAATRPTSSTACSNASSVNPSISYKKNSTNKVEIVSKRGRRKLKHIKKQQIEKTDLNDSYEDIDDDDEDEDDDQTDASKTKTVNLRRTCSVCNAKMHQDFLNDHYSEHYSESAKCSKCDKISSNPANYVTHALSHLSSQFFCINCDKWFRQPLVYRRHKNECKPSIDSTILETIASVSQMKRKNSTSETVINENIQETKRKRIDRSIENVIKETVEQVVQQPVKKRMGRPPKYLKKPEEPTNIPVVEKVEPIKIEKVEPVRNETENEPSSEAKPKRKYNKQIRKIDEAKKTSLRNRTLNKRYTVDNEDLDENLDDEKSETIEKKSDSVSPVSEPAAPITKRKYTKRNTFATELINQQKSTMNTNLANKKLKLKHKRKNSANSLIRQTKLNLRNKRKLRSGYGKKVLNEPNDDEKSNEDDEEEEEDENTTIKEDNEEEEKESQQDEEEKDSKKSNQVINGDEEEDDGTTEDVDDEEDLDIGADDQLEDIDDLVVSDYEMDDNSNNKDDDSAKSDAKTEEPKQAEKAEQPNDPISSLPTLTSLLSQNNPTVLKGGGALANAIASLALKPTKDLSACGTYKVKIERRNPLKPQKESENHEQTPLKDNNQRNSKNEYSAKKLSQLVDDLKDASNGPQTNGNSNSASQPIVVHSSFECPLCDKKFVSYYGLVQHYDQHPTLAVTCIKCEITFENHQALVIHNSNVHNILDKDKENIANNTGNNSTNSTVNNAKNKDSLKLTGKQLQSKTKSQSDDLVENSSVTNGSGNPSGSTDLSLLPSIMTRTSRQQQNQPVSLLGTSNLASTASLKPSLITSAAISNHTLTIKTSGFADLSFIDYSCVNFPRIAQNYCELWPRKLNSTENQQLLMQPLHNYSCEQCGFYFPCKASLELHKMNKVFASSRLNIYESVLTDSGYEASPSSSRCKLFMTNSKYLDYEKTLDEIITKIELTSENKSHLSSSLEETDKNEYLSWFGLVNKTKNRNTNLTEQLFLKLRQQMLDINHQFIIDLDRWKYLHSNEHYLEQLHLYNQNQQQIPPNFQNDYLYSNKIHLKPHVNLNRPLLIRSKKLKRNAQKFMLHSNKHTSSTTQSVPTSPVPTSSPTFNLAQINMKKVASNQQLSSVSVQSKQNSYVNTNKIIPQITTVAPNTTINQSVKAFNRNNSAVSLPTFLSSSATKPQQVTTTFSKPLFSATSGNFSAAAPVVTNNKRKLNAKDSNNKKKYTETNSKESETNDDEDDENNESDEVEDKEVEDDDDDDIVVSSSDDQEETQKSDTTVERTDSTDKDKRVSEDVEEEEENDTEEDSEENRVRDSLSESSTKHMIKTVKIKRLKTKNSNYLNKKNSELAPVPTSKIQHHTQIKLNQARKDQNNQMINQIDKPNRKIDGSLINPPPLYKAPTSANSSILARASGMNNSIFLLSKNMPKFTPYNQTPQTTSPSPAPQPPQLKSATSQKKNLANIMPKLKPYTAPTPVTNFQSSTIPAPPQLIPGNKIIQQQLNNQKAYNGTILNQAINSQNETIDSVVNSFNKSAKTKSTNSNTNGTDLVNNINQTSSSLSSSITTTAGLNASAQSSKLKNSENVTLKCKFCFLIFKGQSEFFHHVVVAHSKMVKQRLNRSNSLSSSSLTTSTNPIIAVSGSISESPSSNNSRNGPSMNSRPKSTQPRQIQPKPPSDSSTKQDLSITTATNV